MRFNDALDRNGHIREEVIASKCFDLIDTHAENSPIAVDVILIRHDDGDQ